MKVKALLIDLIFWIEHIAYITYFSIYVLCFENNAFNVIIFCTIAE